MTEKEVCQKYQQGISAVAIAKFYGKAWLTIKNILLRNNVLIRTENTWTKKYDINEFFFEKIDTEEKAYWLGFLYADGCVTRYYIILQLHQKDKNMIQKFKKSIKYSGPIELREQKIHYGGKYGTVIAKQAKIRISNKKLRKDIVRLGCIPRKTFFLKFPNEKQVPKELKRHFIRGYFDGDGTVYLRKYQAKNKKQRGNAQVISTYEMVSKIKNFFLKRCDINSNSLSISEHSKSKGIYILSFCSHKSMEAFREFLYKDSTIFMERKKAVFDSLDLS